jgi:LmbE family N-acetylglucosaminyl deacetylase
MLVSMTPPVAILSPHLDDAVLSCWQELTRPGDVQVVNVFAGVPPADAETGWWDASSGTRDSERMVQERIEEDRAALSLAGREPLNLDFLDNQYRGAPQAVEALVAALRATLRRDATIWAPGAIAPMPEHPGIPGAGRVPHPDHVAVRDAALALRAAGWTVSLYVDLPHASVRGWPDWVTGAGDDEHGRLAAALWERGLAAAGLMPDQLQPEVGRLAPDAFARKAEAVRRYRSQVATLERAFGRRLDDPALLGYEVVWRLPALAAAA